MMFLLPWEHPWSLSCTDDGRPHEGYVELSHGSFNHTPRKDWWRRGNFAGTLGTSVTDVLTPVKFPNNTGKLLPSEYYSQFRDWYSRMVKVSTDRFLDDISWVANFKFVFERKSFQQKVQSGWKYQNEYRNGGMGGFNGYSKSIGLSQRGNGGNGSSNGNTNNSSGGNSHGYNSFNGNGGGDRSWLNDRGRQSRRVDFDDQDGD